LDFDGVICDSTPECVVTAWNGWLSYTSNDGFVRKPADVPEPFREALGKGRVHVRTAGEYLILIEAERAGRVIHSQSDYDKEFERYRNEIAAFAKLFFDARERLRSESEEHWFGLHDVYGGISDGLAVLSPRLEVFVVTGKDSRSVRMFFQRMGSPLSADHVYDKDAAHDKLSAIRAIAETSGRALSSITFLDDNVHHLLPPLEAGCHAVMASWGYHTDEQIRVAQGRGVPILQLSDWVDTIVRWNE